MSGIGEMYKQNPIKVKKSSDVNVDIVFVIDATESMQPLIDKVRSITLSLRDDIDKGMEKFQRRVHNLRIKVIVFRDYYVDDKYAMEESRFFILPEEKEDFESFVSDIHAGGGGDEPESGLEALAMALRADQFVQEGTNQRHIVVLFTDASAHPYEQRKDGVPKNYPEKMFGSLRDLFQVWGQVQNAMGASPKHDFGIPMSYSAKRLILFAPKVYPWNEIENLDNTMLRTMNKGNGGKDLILDEVITMICGSIVK